MPPEPQRAYPRELPAVPLRETVVFPLTLQPLAIGRPAAVEAVNRALAGDRLLFLSLQTGEAEEPGPDDLLALHEHGARDETLDLLEAQVALVHGVLHAAADALDHGVGAALGFRADLRGADALERRR